MVAAVAIGAGASPGAVGGASEALVLEVDIAVLISAIGVVVDTAVDSAKLGVSIEVVVAVAGSAAGDAAEGVLGAEVEGGKRAVETDTTTERDIGIAAVAGVHGETVAPGVSSAGALGPDGASGKRVPLRVRAVSGSFPTKSHSSKKCSNEEEGPHVRKKRSKTKVKKKKVH